MPPPPPAGSPPGWDPTANMVLPPYLANETVATPLSTWLVQPSNVTSVDAAASQAQELQSAIAAVR